MSDDGRHGGGGRYSSGGGYGDRGGGYGVSDGGGRSEGYGGNSQTRGGCSFVLVSLLYLDYFDFIDIRIPLFVHMYLFTSSYLCV